MGLRSGSEVRVTYKNINTRTGLYAMASADAIGTPINLTHLAVCDGITP